MLFQINKPNISELQMHKAWRIFIWIYFAVAAIFFLLLDARGLPDYEAYGGIFINSDNLKEPLFSYLNNTFRNFGLSYEQFRMLLLVFSMGALLYLNLTLQRYSIYPKSPILNIITSVVLTYIFSIFIFEFFIVRIRAGLAIAFICLSIANVLRMPKNCLIWISSVALIFAALFIHKSTSVILMSVFAVTIFCFFNPKLNILKNTWDIGDATKVMLYILATIFLLFLILTQNQIRTTIVISNLNSARLVALAIIPLIVFMIDRIFLSQKGKNFLESLSWAKSFEEFYAILSIALLMIYVLGMTKDSGEALVRFYTLLSFPALIGLVGAGSMLAVPLCSYLLLINASFFLATLNMWPGFMLDLMRWLGKS